MSRRRQHVLALECCAWHWHLAGERTQWLNTNVETEHKLSMSSISTLPFRWWVYGLLNSRWAGLRLADSSQMPSALLDSRLTLSRLGQSVPLMNGILVAPPWVRLVLNSSSPRVEDRAVSGRQAVTPTAVAPSVLLARKYTPSYVRAVYRKDVRSIDGWAV